MKTKKVLAGMLSIACLVCALQFPTVYAIGSLPMGNGITINPDVNTDNEINNNDLVELREVLVEKSTIETFDVNNDETCNVKDLVSLKKFVETNYGKDNDHVMN